MPITAIAILLLLATAVLPPSAARADQTDARLEGLFSQLLEAPDPLEARQLEGAIWSIWVQSDDGAVQILMYDGIDALQNRDYTRALSKFDQMVLIAPDFAEGWNKRATVHYLLGNYAQSLADIAKTLELEPRHFGALAGRGLVYVELQDERRALKAFEDALAIHPNLPSAAINASKLRKVLRDRQI
ncbi:MAG: tetratricopeptide repeat protein [Kiloniellaceae bacterium]